MHMRHHMRARTPLPLIAAAVAAGSYLLARQMRRNHDAGVTHYFVDHGIGHDAHMRMSPGTGMALAAALAAGAAGVMLTRGRRHEGPSTIEESIDIDVPLSTAYNQWTQFEEFPRFMANVDEVRQLDDTHLHWRANVGGRTKEWDAEIVEQIPDRRIAWRSTGGVHNSGAVSFHPISDTRTRVLLHMDYEPQTLDERVGDAIGAVRHMARGNLKRFKQLMESQGAETGAWRGTVPQH